VTSEPNNLDVVPKTKIEGPPASGGAQSSSSSSGKTSYQVRRGTLGTRIARQRNEDLPRTTISTPAPTTRSEQAVPNAPAGSGGFGDDGTLDHLPPLDLPGEVTQSVATPPAAPAAKSSADKGKEKTDELRGAASPPAPVEPAAASASAPAPESAFTASVGPGLARFVAVDLKLAGGSAPSSQGLKWLVEKGYRTLLDLRASSEVPSSFIAEVTQHGLRYLALPIAPNTIDRDHVARFNFELAASEARPLYFFDSAGDRAGALWYIRRIVVDRVDQQVAKREAEELGLKDEVYWLASTKYVASVTPSAAKSSPSSQPAQVPPGALDPQKTPPASIGSAGGQTPPATTASAQPGPKLPASPQPVAPTAAARPIPDSPVPQTSEITPSSDIPAELTSAVTSDPAGSPPPPSWRPLAAMMITGLSLPLAFWSRTIVPSILARTRASLPGSGPRRKSLPRESGA
jgi:protein tyrosine phosphatase (PTP) superfamily phosphohydrolase (DUF442 family)